MQMQSQYCEVCTRYVKRKLVYCRLHFTAWILDEPGKEKQLELRRKKQKSEEFWRNDAFGIEGALATPRASASGDRSVKR
jgi:hypothetical protein